MAWSSVGVDGGGVGVAGGVVGVVATGVGVIGVVGVICGVGVATAVDRGVGDGDACVVAAA